MRPLGGGSSRWCRKPATEKSKAQWEAAVSHCSHALSVLLPCGIWFLGRLSANLCPRGAKETLRKGRAGGNTLPVSNYATKLR